MKATVIFTHPPTAASKVIDSMKPTAAAMPRVTLRNIDEAVANRNYTSSVIAREQQVLESSDLIIFQFPTLCFSCPATLKQYIDKVLCNGWAFGSRAALKGKYLAIITTMDQTSDYHDLEGSYSYSIVYKTFQAIAHFCGMKYVDHLFVFTNTETDAQDLYSAFMRRVVNTSMGIKDDPATRTPAMTPRLSPRMEPEPAPSPEAPVDTEPVAAPTPQDAPEYPEEPMAEPPAELATQPAEEPAAEPVHTEEPAPVLEDQPVAPEEPAPEDQHVMPQEPYVEEDDPNMVVYPQEPHVDEEQPPAELGVPARAE